MSVLLNGSTDRADWAACPDYGTRSFTVAAWVWPGITTPAHTGVVWGAHTSGDSGSPVAYLLFSGTTWTVWIQRSGNTAQRRVTNEAMTPFRWQHLCATATDTAGADTHIYFDGVECTYSAYIDGSLLSGWGGSYVVGGRKNDDTLNLVGAVSSPAVWGRVLSADEIGALAQGVRPIDIPYGLAWAPPLDYDYLDPVSGKTGTEDAVGGTLLRGEDWEPPKLWKPRTWFLGAAAGGFQPAWARGSNVLIGAGA